MLRQSKQMEARSMHIMHHYQSFYILNIGDVLLQYKAPAKKYFHSKILVCDILWSIYTIVQFPNRMVNIYFSISTILNSSRSVVL